MPFLLAVALLGSSGATRSATLFVVGEALSWDVMTKNLTLVLAGATAILGLDYSVGGELAGVMTFTLGAVSVLLAVLVLATVFPQRG